MSSVPDLMSEPQLKRRCDLLRLCCAICGADGDAARRLCEERKDAIDWMALVAVAAEFRLGMLLHRAVQQAHLIEIVSPAAVDALQMIYAQSRARSLVVTAELRQLLDRLASQQIPAIAFKGPAFGAQLYGDVAMRTYSDLDVLVRKCDLARVTRVMLDAGYRAGNMPLDWEISFERDAGTSVDLHWSIAHRNHQFPLTADELWARHSTVSLAGASVPVLGAEDTLLAICFNGLTEDWQRLDRVADVAALVRGSAAIDWQSFLDMCRRHGCERIVLLGLHLARELFMVRLASVVEIRLHAHRKAMAAAGYERDDYLAFAVTATDRRRGFDAWHFMLRMRERSRERTPYYQAMAYDVFKPKVDDAAWQRASRQLLYAVLRLPLLGIKHGLRAIGHGPDNRP